MAEREYRVLVHDDEGSYWPKWTDYLDDFASGQTLDELREAVIEASLSISPRRRVTDDAWTGWPRTR